MTRRPFGGPSTRNCSRWQCSETLVISGNGGRVAIRRYLKAWLQLREGGLGASLNEAN
jgi:hypothetical protein